MWECETCDAQFETPDKKCVKGRRGGHPDMDEEDDFLDQCPECGQVERMHEIEEIDDE